MSQLIPQHQSELSLVGLLCAKDERRTFALQPHHAVIVLSRCIRSLNVTRCETVEDLIARREACALLAGLRLEISREALGRETL